MITDKFTEAQLEMIYTGIWIASVVMFVFLIIFFTKRFKVIRNRARERQNAYLQRKEQYSHITSENFAEIPRENVAEAVIFQCMRKEEEDFDHYFENFNDSEKTIYGIYQVLMTLQGKHTSLHSVFISPALEPYIPIITDIFSNVGAYELSDLMRAARRFAEIIEEDAEEIDDDPELGIYARYNFSDFTNEFLTLVNASNFNDKLITFVLDHKEDFYEDEMDSKGDDNDEGISDEI